METDSVDCVKVGSAASSNAEERDELQSTTLSIIYDTLPEEMDGHRAANNDRIEHGGG